MNKLSHRLVPNASNVETRCAKTEALLAGRVRANKDGRVGFVSEVDRRAAVQFVAENAKPPAELLLEASLDRDKLEARGSAAL